MRTMEGDSEITKKPVLDFFLESAKNASKREKSGKNSSKIITAIRLRKRFLVDYLVFCFCRDVSMGTRCWAHMLCVRAGRARRTPSFLLRAVGVFRGRHGWQGEEVRKQRKRTAEGGRKQRKKEQEE